MKTKQFFIALLLAVAPLFSYAAPIQYSLDTWVGTGSQIGPFGTVDLVQSGNNVNVTVTLAPSVGFVYTGAGYSLMWNMSSSSQVTNLDSNFSIVSGAPFDKNGTSWGYAVECNNPAACGQGGSNPYVGSLTFTLTNALISDFTANDKGYFFGSDVCTSTTGVGCQGTTGVAISSDPKSPPSGFQSTPVTSPATTLLLLMGLGMFLIGIYLRQKALE